MAEQPWEPAPARLPCSPQPCPPGGSPGAGRCKGSPRTTGPPPSSPAREKLSLASGVFVASSLWFLRSTVHSSVPCPLTLTHPHRGAPGNPGWVTGGCSQGPRARRGLPLLPRETHLLRSRLQQLRLEAERTQVSAARCPPPPPCPLLPRVGRGLWSRGQRGEQPLCSPTDI